MRTNSGPTPSPVRAVYGRPDFRPRPQGAQENSERETQDRRAGTKKMDRRPRTNAIEQRADAHSGAGGLRPSRRT